MKKSITSKILSPGSRFPSRAAGLPRLIDVMKMPGWWRKYSASCPPRILKPRPAKHNKNLNKRCVLYFKKKQTQSIKGDTGSLKNDTVLCTFRRTFLQFYGDLFSPDAVHGCFTGLFLENNIITLLNTVIILSILRPKCICVAHSDYVSGLLYASIVQWRSFIGKQLRPCLYEVR